MSRTFETIDRRPGSTSESRSMPARLTFLCCSLTASASGQCTLQKYCCILREISLGDEGVYCIRCLWHIVGLHCTFAHRTVLVCYTCYHPADRVKVSRVAHTPRDWCASTYNILSSARDHTNLARDTHFMCLLRVTAQ